MGVYYNTIIIKIKKKERRKKLIDCEPDVSLDNVKHVWGWIESNPNEMGYR